METANIALALYQPDIPQNTATILRLGACLGVPVHIIEPAGFVWSERSLRRAGMDYIDHVRIIRHASWRRFQAGMERHRLVLATTKAACNYTSLEFAHGDVILFGRESAGVPDSVHDAADCRVTIAMQPGMRSLNVAMAAAMITGEALRQLRSG